MGLDRYPLIHGRHRTQRWGYGIALLALLLWGCNRKIDQPGPAPPPPAYTGPAFLHGTVGSMTRVQGYHPLLVSGFGLVVNLNGAGSAEVPAYLRQWLINEMRKKGVGSPTMGMQGVSPDQLLASPNTAVVVVQGLIPPGAIKGSRFDVLVSSMPQTQTTSLEGGRLWTTDLSVNGDDPAMRFTHRLATASGVMYINPFDSQTPEAQQRQLRRQAVAISGGVVTQPRKVELILNQPSWQRSRLIADRINERFPKAPTDRFETAVPINDARINLFIPSRFGGREAVLLDRINHLFVQRSALFEQAKGQQLADLLVAQPRYGSNIALAWVAMGKTVLPIIRNYYAYADLKVRLAALEAGAKLADEAATTHLAQLAGQADPQWRTHAAKLLVHLPHSLRGARTLHALLNDEDRSVRLAAYESLAAINDPSIQRQAIDGVTPDRFKFALDLVPATRPLIYIAQNRVPRLVIFNPMLALEPPFFTKLWGNRLMLRATDENQPVTVFYQQPNQVEGQAYEVDSTLAEVIYLLAHRPTVSSPANGLDLSYGQVANTVYQLCDQGIVDSDIQLQISPLAEAIARHQQRDQQRARPETLQEQPIIPH